MLSARHSRRLLLPLIALTATLGLAAAACGGGSSGGGGTSTSVEDEGEPQRGGEVVMGLEAETTGGYCLPTAQLAISGIQVVNAIYDTLTVPTESGEYVPFLAESVEPNADFTEWTITLRPNVTFHNGEALTAEAVKINMDAWKEGILLSNVFEDLGEVTVVDDLTVRAQTNAPWAAFDAALYGNGRFGIAAPEQLAEIDSEFCNTNPIGTGPFMLDEWTPNSEFVATANPDYWGVDENGEQLPYLDQITFVPIIEAAQRVNALEQGRIDLMHTSSAKQTERLEGLGDEVKLVIEEPSVREVDYYILNAGEPPLDTRDGRLAVAYALNREEVNQVQNNGRLDIANGPFDVDVPGYVEDPGFPQYDPERAREFVEKVKAETGSFDLTLQTTPDPENSAEAQQLKEQLEDVGISADISQVEQSAFISEVVAGNASLALWRNLHSDPVFPDAGTTPWFKSDHIINFARYDDPEVDRLLAEGRATTDEADLERIYTEFNEKMAQEAYYIWNWYVDWTIASKPDVNGVTGPTLPNGSDKWLFLYGRVPTAGLWRS